MARPSNFSSSYHSGGGGKVLASGGAGNLDEILPYYPADSSAGSSGANKHQRQASTSKLTKLDVGSQQQSIPGHQRRSRSPRVWMESSFVGVKPISSPETPSGDVASFVFDDPFLLNGLGNNESGYGGGSGNELVPMVKLRSGSAQLDAYMVHRELELRNGHFHSRKASSCSEQNLSLPSSQQTWSMTMPEKKSSANGRLHSSNQSFNTLHDRYDSSDFKDLRNCPDSQEVATTAAMLTDGLQKRIFCVDPEDLPASAAGEGNNTKSAASSKTTVGNPNAANNHSSSSKRENNSRSPSNQQRPNNHHQELERRGSTSLDDVLSSLLALPSSPANKQQSATGDGVNEKTRNTAAIAQQSTSPVGSSPAAGIDNGSLVARSGSLRRPTSQPDLENRGGSPSAGSNAYSWRTRAGENRGLGPENSSQAGTGGHPHQVVNTHNEGRGQGRLDSSSGDERASRSKSPSLLEDSSEGLAHMSNSSRRQTHQPYHQEDRSVAGLGTRDNNLSVRHDHQRHVSGGSNRFTPSPEPFFFEDLEIRVMPKDAADPSLNPASSSLFESNPSSAVGNAQALPTGLLGPNKLAPGSPGGVGTGLQPLSNILIKCRNGNCPNSCLIEEAQQTYKTCRNCHTYYCSRECRRAHRPRHMRHCMQLKASSLLTELMHQIRDIKDVYLQISKVARQGYASRGFGCVKLFFQTVEDLEEFLENRRLDKITPGYLPVQDLMPEEMGHDNFKSLLDMCQTYSPDTKMVVYAAVCIWSEVPGSENTKFERLLIVKCVKMKLSPALSPRHQQTSQSHSQQSPHRSPRVPAINPIQLRQEAIITRDVEGQETVIIASKGPVATLAEKRLARSTVLNVLSRRGVDLVGEFPDVAKRLDAYADTGHHFGHVIFYPRDEDTGNLFMCIVMLEIDSDRFRSLPKDMANLQVVTIGDD